MKEVKKTVWEVKCQEFCPTMPGRGRDCCCDGHGNACAEGEACCESCGKNGCDPCASEKAKADRMKTPTCGKMRVKKVLVKKEVVCKVPSYKCIVVYSCPCGGSGKDCGSRQTPPPAPKASANPPLPPAPTPSKTTQTAPMPPILGA